MYAIHQVFVVQVGAGGKPGHAHVANDVALGHVRTHMDIGGEAGTGRGA